MEPVLPSASEQVYFKWRAFSLYTGAYDLLGVKFDSLATEGIHPGATRLRRARPQTRSSASLGRTEYSQVTCWVFGENSTLEGKELGLTKSVSPNILSQSYDSSHEASGVQNPLIGRGWESATAPG
jgi:hypothetical protein